MKILLINSCHYRRGGADVVYLNTLHLLDSRGHKVIAFSQQNLNNLFVYSSDFFVKPFEVYKLSVLGKILNASRVIYSKEAARNLECLINEQEPDIAHIHLYKGVLTSSVLRVLRRKKIPIVITLHDFGLLCPRSVFLDGNKKLCEKCVSSSAINCILNKCNRGSYLYSTMTFLEYSFTRLFFGADKFFDKLICVSRFNYEKHRRHTSLSDKLIQQYNFVPQNEMLKTPFKRGDYFIYFGRLTDGKGLDTLFNAFKIAKEPVKLLVLGTGDIELYLRNRIYSEEINNIKMLGFKEGAELKNFVANSSFIIVPSEFYENNPMVIVEGFASGKPVIGSRLGGISELIKEGETGYTFEATNEIELATILDKAHRITDAEYEEMSNWTLQFANMHFSEESHYQNLLKIYNSLLEKPAFID